MLEVKDVVVAYKGVPALRNVSIRVEAGTLTTILGANGAGKTSLLRAIMGLAAVQSGTISFEGRPLNRLPCHRVARRGLALVPERRDLFPDMTVRENLEMGAYTRSDRRGARKDYDMVLELFPTLARRQGQRAATMSGGEQQMVAIGRGLMSNPRLLLLDEPSLGLAPRLVSEIFAKIAVLREMGTTILLVEQNARLSLSVADYGFTLAEGNVSLEGSAAELRSSEEVQRSYLGVI